MPKLMRRFLMLATALLAGGLLTACEDVLDVLELGPIFGLYTLRSINGEPLPSFSGEFEYIAGSIQLNSDDTYSLSSTTKFRGMGKSETTTQTGRFSGRGSTVTFDFGKFTATRSGNTLTFVVDNGDTFVYRK